jgi:hypothetical protein
MIDGGSDAGMIANGDPTFGYGSAVENPWTLFVMGSCALFTARAA